MMDDQLRNSGGRDLVYGEIDGYLVFIPLERAIELVALRKALWSSDTWGEFRSRVPKPDYAELGELLADRISFEQFYELELKERPGITHHEALRAYKALPVRDRIPEDDDPFSVEDIPFVYDGDWPDWPAQEMLNWVPKVLRNKFGINKESVLNGRFLTFDPMREDEIVVAFEGVGYRCARDDALVRRASGYVD